MSQTQASARNIWDATIGGKPVVGATAENSRQTSMRDVEMFSEMTGDMNPLHYDSALANASPFGGLIVQGGVTSGLLNAIVAENLPGPGSLFLSVEWRFVKAVKVGERITGRVEVTSVRDDKPICTLASACATSRARIVWSGPPPRILWRSVHRRRARQRAKCRGEAVCSLPRQGRHGRALPGNAPSTCCRHSRRVRIVRLPA
jgi:acyl dehydratase